MSEDYLNEWTVPIDHNTIVKYVCAKDIRPGSELDAAEASVAIRYTLDWLACAYHADPATVCDFLEQRYDDLSRS